MTQQQTMHEIIRQTAQVIQPDVCHDAVMHEMRGASIVLLGEATHGSHEFYSARAAITRRLIDEAGFDAIAVESDWPDALRVSRFVRGSGVSHGMAHADLTAEQALASYHRFPLWMWRNTEVVELIKWLRARNDQRPSPEDRIGFYGLDLYSLRNSMKSVVRYLQAVDPEAASVARARYGCFDHLAAEPQQYGYAATFGIKKNCENEVVQQLLALREDAEKFLAHDGPAAQDELFYAQQNALVAQNAEAYYRAMFKGRDESWNLRDTHMADTLDALIAHLSHAKKRPAKIVVWAHNSHIGDARATESGEHGQLNLGQLVRERHLPDNTFLLGFTTHTGTVTAASEWDQPAELKRVRPSHPESFEHLFHSTDLGNFFLPIRGRKAVIDGLARQRLERAIGVIYLPQSERTSHYFYADMGHQFDAVIHVDQTRALHPLDRTPYWQHTDMPETYPSGF